MYNPSMEINLQHPLKDYGQLEYARQEGIYTDEIMPFEKGWGASGKSQSGDRSKELGIGFKTGHKSRKQEFAECGCQ